MDDRPTPGSTRREGIPAVPLLLADGQAWYLACPSTRFRPVLSRRVDALGRAVDAIRLVSEVGYPAGIRREIDRLRSECMAGSPAGLRDAVISLGAALLLRAHQVGPSFAASLFRRTPAGDFARLADAIVEIVTIDQDFGP